MEDTNERKQPVSVSMTPYLLRLIDRAAGHKNRSEFVCKRVEMLIKPDPEALGRYFALRWPEHVDTLMATLIRFSR